MSGFVSDMRRSGKRAIAARLRHRRHPRPTVRLRHRPSGSAARPCQCQTWQLGCELPRRRPPSSLGNLITRQGTFFLYAAIGVGAFVFFLARVPETKDRTLEQIQDYLNIAAVHPTKESV